MPRETRYERNKRLRRERSAAARARGTHTRDEWDALVSEFGRCVRCGSTDSGPVKDHIIPIYQGGSDAIGNLQPLCWTCNSSKGAENFNWVEYRRQHGWEAAA